MLDYTLTDADYDYINQTLACIQADALQKANLPSPESPITAESSYSENDPQSQSSQSETEQRTFFWQPEPQDSGTQTATTSSRKRPHSEISTEEKTEQKVARRKELNRIAAANSRQRKKEEKQALENKIITLKAQQEQLKQRVANLQAGNTDLRQGLGQMVLLILETAAQTDKTKTTAPHRP